MSEAPRGPGARMIPRFCRGCCAMPSVWRSRPGRTRTSRPSADGQFAIPALPAGTCRVGVSDTIEQGQWEDRAWLEAMRDDGTGFVLLDGAAERLSLRLGR